MPTPTPPLDEPPSEWIATHYRRIYQAAWKLTGDAVEAEDLAQETFVIALDRWRRFTRRSSDFTWLYGILLRLNRRRLRSLARLRRRLQQYAEKQTGRRESPDPAVQWKEKQWRESIWADVSKLPHRQRDAVTLRYGEGLSYDEIAAVVGCAVGTAKTRVHHGLERLRIRQGKLSDGQNEIASKQTQQLPLRNTNFIRL